MVFIYLGEKARITGIDLVIDRETKRRYRFHLGDKLRAHFKLGPDDTDEHPRYVDGILEFIENDQTFQPTGNIAFEPAKIYNQKGGVRHETRYMVNITMQELSHFELLMTKAQLEQTRTRQLIKRNQPIDEDVEEETHL